MGSTSDAILRQLGQALALNIAIGFTTPQIDQWWDLLPCVVIADRDC